MKRLLKSRLAGARFLALMGGNNFGGGSAVHRLPPPCRPEPQQPPSPHCDEGAITQVATGSVVVPLYTDGTTPVFADRGGRGIPWWKGVVFSYSVSDGAVLGAELWTGAVTSLDSWDKQWGRAVLQPVHCRVSI